MSEPEGITNHPASTETAEDAKLNTSSQPKTNEKTPQIDTGHLPKGLAEKVETVNVSTLETNK